jgi:nucleotidyltransferase/DNA polymerase involved in DNA repair
LASQAAARPRVAGGRRRRPGARRALEASGLDPARPAAARAEIPPLAAKVWRHCGAKGLHGRTVTLKVKYADFQIITRSRTTSTSIS